jgi:hypothetical protein
MDFDLRMPIGIMFSIFGLILTGYGLATKGSEIYQKCLGKNFNVSWGIVLLVFGGLMLALALKSRKAP